MKDLIPIGNKVVTKSGNMEAIVTGVCIRGKSGDSVEYEVATFLNGERKSTWLNDFEIEVKKESNPIGFSNPINDKPLLGK